MTRLDNFYWFFFIFRRIEQEKMKKFYKELQNVDYTTWGDICLIF